MAEREDRFANIAAAEVVQSAADTLTFTEMLTGISLGQGVGMLIDEIDYGIKFSTFGFFATSADNLQIAITSSNDVLDIEDISDRRILHTFLMYHRFVTSGADYLFWPKVFQFFPPMIIAAPRLYLAMDSISLGTAGTARTRIYFRYVQLSAQQYLELAEAFILVG